MGEKGICGSELDDMGGSQTREERLVIGADFDWLVGEGSLGDEEVMGRNGVKGRNIEG